MKNKIKERFAKFHDLPSELHTLEYKFVISTALLLVLLIILLFVIGADNPFLVSLTCLAIFFTVNIYYFLTVTSERLLVLEAECVDIEYSKLRMLRTDNVAKLTLLKNGNYYYISVSKNTAKYVKEGMILRVYITEQNVYQKDPASYKLFNPLHICTAKIKS